MLIGNLSAKIGNGYNHEKETVAIGKHDLGERKTRGDSLVCFYTSNELVIANTLFQILSRPLTHGKILVEKSEIRLISS